MIVDTPSTDNPYKQMSTLGEGTFATVISAKNKLTGQIVAIKQIAADPLSIEFVEEEVNKLSNLKNDHIVEFISSFTEQNRVNVVMQLCRGGSLRSIIGKKMDSKALVHFIKQIVSAFIELDSQNIMHLDLKPENILICQDNYYKICDFGCSQNSTTSTIPKFSSLVFGTFNYMPPQLLESNPLNAKSSSIDIWSLGCICYELLYGKLPFQLDSQGKIQRKQVQSFYKGNYVIKFEELKQEKNPKQSNFSVQRKQCVVNLIKLMLKRDPKERVTWKDLRTILILQYEVLQIQFFSVKVAAQNHLKIMRILSSVILLLKANVPQKPHRFDHPFFIQNHKQLKHLEDRTISLSYIYCYKFRQTFEYKAKYRLPQNIIDDLWLIYNQMNKQQLEQVDLRDIYMKGPEHQAYYQTNVYANLVKMLFNKINVYPTEQLWESMKFLKVFLEEAAQIFKGEESSLFCNAAQMQNTLKMYGIQ